MSFGFYSKSPGIQDVAIMIPDFISIQGHAQNFLVLLQPIYAVGRLF